jgi:hypothetical protein
MRRANSFASREVRKPCCSLLRFVIEIEAAAVTLVVEVPELEVSVLDGFARAIR